MRLMMTPPLPLLTTHDFSQSFHPAFLSNGLLGVRPGAIPLLADPFAGAVPPSSFDPTVPATLAGFMYRDVSLHEVLAPAPYPFATAVLVDGVDVSTRAGATPVAQSLDMATGELATQFELACGAACRVRLNATLFLSRRMPTVAAMRVRAAVDPPTRNLTLAPRLSLSGAPNCSVAPNCTVPASNYSSTTPGPGMPGWAAWVWDKRVQYLGGVSNSGSRAGLVALPNMTTTTAGGVVYDVLVSAVSSGISPRQDPVLAAYEHVERAAYAGGFDALQRQNRAAWAKLWEARPIVHGASVADDQRTIDGAFFYLHSASSPSAQFGIPCYALSQPGRMYDGGILEDFDFLMVLPVALGDASSGAALARYRTRTLGAAQQHAAASGWVGHNGRPAALFPSTASMVDGHPTASAFEAWAKDYPGLGAALAVYEAAAIAADPSFVRDEAWPLLRSVAEWVVARGEWTSRGFEFGRSMNRDEDKPTVIDASMLTLAALRMLEVALECHATLPSSHRDDAAAARWEEVRRALFYAVEGDVILPFVGAAVAHASPANWSLGNLQQLLAHGVPSRVTPAQLHATLQAEERMRQRWSTAHAADPKHNRPPLCDVEYMSCPAMAHGAALLGSRATAGELLRRLGGRMRLPPFDLAKEYSVNTYAAYLSNDGALISTLYALAGVQPKMGAASAEDWLPRNATLPDGWDAVTFGRVVVDGSAYRMVAAHGERASLTKVGRSDGRSVGGRSRYV